MVFDAASPKEYVRLVPGVRIRPEVFIEGRAQNVLDHVQGRPVAINQFYYYLYIERIFSMVFFSNFFSHV